jgi:hypothetical protein
MILSIFYFLLRNEFTHMQVGKKFIWSNCVQSRIHETTSRNSSSSSSSSRENDSYSLPAYDLYNAGFGICDKLNRFIHHHKLYLCALSYFFLTCCCIRALRQKCFPYRCGVATKSVGSDLKRYFDFILSSALHNTFKIIVLLLLILLLTTTKRKMN